MMIREPNISPNMRCLGWMVGMTVSTVSCSLINRVVPCLPWKENNPSIETAAIFGAVWGAVSYGFFLCSKTENLSALRNLQMIYVSALVPAFLLNSVERPLYNILSPYTPFAVLGIAQYILTRPQMGHG